MRVLVTGGTGVLGRAFGPLAEAAGHDVRAAGRAGLDLFDPLAVAAAVRGADAVLHLATRSTGRDHPNPALGATLHAEDAGRALLAALDVASGVYNVCRDGERVSNRRFAEATGWHPQR